jgi:hypothetical protein
MTIRKIPAVCIVFGQLWMPNRRIDIHGFYQECSLALNGVPVESNYTLLL